MASESPGMGSSTPLLCLCSSPVYCSGLGPLSLQSIFDHLSHPQQWPFLWSSSAWAGFSGQSSSELVATFLHPGEARQDGTTFPLWCEEALIRFLGQQLGN